MGTKLQRLLEKHREKLISSIVAVLGSSDAEK